MAAVGGGAGINRSPNSNGRDHSLRDGMEAEELPPTLEVDYAPVVSSARFYASEAHDRRLASNTLSPSLTPSRPPRLQSEDDVFDVATPANDAGGVSSTVSDLWRAIVNSLFVPIGEECGGDMMLTDDTPVQHPAGAVIHQPIQPRPLSSSAPDPPPSQPPREPGHASAMITTTASSTPTSASTSTSTSTVTLQHARSPRTSAAAAPTSAGTRVPSMAHHHQHQGQHQRVVVDERFLIAAAMLVNSTLLYVLLSRSSGASAGGNRTAVCGFSDVVGKVADVVQRAFTAQSGTGGA
jgi:hypothetical protein